MFNRVEEEESNTRREHLRECSFTKFGTAFINNLSGFRSVTGATTRTRFSGHSLVWITVRTGSLNDSRGIDGGRATFTESRTRNTVSDTKGSRNAKLNWKSVLCTNYARRGPPVESTFSTHERNYIDLCLSV